MSLAERTHTACGCDAMLADDLSKHREDCPYRRGTVLDMRHLLPNLEPYTARQATEAENERAKLAQQIGERFIQSVEQSSGHQPTNEELRQAMRDAGLLP